MKLILFFLTFCLMVSLSCTKDKVVDYGNYDITISGVIKKPEVTTYQYGTHILQTGTIIYALRSNAVNLDNFLNKLVTISGDKINGYPVEGGPDYIDVLIVN